MPSETVRTIVKARLPRHVKSCTVHSLGRSSLLGRFPQLKKKEPETRKSRQLIRDRVNQMKLEFVVGDENWSLVEHYLQELLRFSIANLTDTKLEEEVAALAVEYNLNAPQDHGLEVQCHREVRNLLRARLEVLKQHLIYDYEDMLYVPAVFQLPIPQYDFVFVDEAQDLSAVTLEIVLRAVREGGRRLFVGDERQAIYGFAGADADSLGRIVKRTNATTLPLSVTYRCPRFHVALAKRLAPEMEAAPNAIEGKVFVIKEAWLPKWVRKGVRLIQFCDGGAKPHHRRQNHGHQNIVYTRFKSKVYGLAPKVGRFRVETRLRSRVQQWLPFLVQGKD